MTVARIATRTTPIPVTVGTSEQRQQHEGLKVTTVTGIAMPEGFIPVTVDTFEALGAGGWWGDIMGGVGTRTHITP